MEDLSAASHAGRRGVFQDVLRAQQRQPGHRRRHRPGGHAPPGREVVQRDSSRTRSAARLRRRPRSLDGVKKHTMTDRVQLPRLYLAWHTPAIYQPGDAAMDIAASLMTGGKNARLYRRLVYDLQIAQDVNAFQQSQGLGSVFMIVATARPGQSLEQDSTSDRRGAREVAIDACRRSRNGARVESARRRTSIARWSALGGSRGRPIS